MTTDPRSYERALEYHKSEREPSVSIRRGWTFASLAAAMDENDADDMRAAKFPQSVIDSWLAKEETR